MVETKKMESERANSGWAAIVVAFALVVVSGAMFVAFRTTAISDEERAASDDAIRLLDARRALEMSTLEIVVLRMLESLELDEDLDTRIDAVAAEVESATDDLASVAQGDGLVAEEAAALLDEVAEAVEDPREGDLADLFTVAEDYARWAGSLDVVTDRREAIHQLSFVSTLPYHVMVEGIAADASVEDRPIDPAAAAFFEQMTEVVRTEGGWFGEDAGTPLVGSVWIEVDDAREFLPEAEARMSDLLENSDLIGYDAWMRELGDSNTPPPFELSEMLRVADSIQPQLAAEIEALSADDEIARRATMTADDGRANALLVASAAAGLLALLALAAGVWRIRATNQASMERARLATTDALTGAHNRRVLEEVTEAMIEDPSWPHHLVAMIDLDRFKLTNDVHGHAAGDAVLIAVAQRLQHVLDGIIRDQSDANGSVVRLGGDEFLLTIHSQSPVDVAHVRGQLEGVRQSFIEFEDTSIELRFSLGIAQAEHDHPGGAGLADLISAADLAVYEDKETRQSGRRHDLPAEVNTR